MRGELGVAAGEGKRGRARGIATPLLALAVGVSLGGPPAGAEAATTCSFDLVSHTLSVGGDPERGTRLEVFNGEILVYHLTASGIVIVNCASGTPTVTNTDTIEVIHAQDGDSDRINIVEPDEFAPGFTDETLGMFDLADEIEIVLDLGGSGDDSLSVFGTSAAGGSDTIVLGKDGVNWNPSDPVDDRDILTAEFPGMDSYEVSLGPDENTFTAQGGQGTGAAVEVPIEVTGGTGVDRFTGGDGPDTIEAFSGRDSLKGLAGNDDLIGGDGADSMRGGAGHDRLFAKDGKRDRRIDCGPGGADGATRDAKDPPAASC